MRISVQDKILQVLKNEPINLDLARHFVDILLSETKMSTAGYPFLTESAYRCLIENVSYLFKQGEEALEVLLKLEHLFNSSGLITDPDQHASVQRALAVCRQVIFTANICAPTDLWVLKNILSNWTELGIDVKHLPEEFSLSNIAQQFDLKEKRIKVDLDFLFSRGLIDRAESLYKKPAFFHAYLDSPSLKHIPQNLKGDIVDTIKYFILGKLTDEDFVRDFFTVPSLQTHEQGWHADSLKTELGFRIVPLLIATHQLKKNELLTLGTSFFEVFTDSNHYLLSLLKYLGYFNAKGKVNLLGERVFSRGAGPFGIIYAYQSYFSHPQSQYRHAKATAWVSRRANIDASQKANAKAFTAALHALERFKNDTKFAYDVFIEHAVGKGEATKQHWNSPLHTEDMLYIGADLEEDAIKGAAEAQKKGELPPQMLLLSNADIGKPETLYDFLKANVTTSQNIVMFVGNGFHEVREQTDASMIAVFKAYHDMGILLVFIEESSLSDHDIRQTAWNTYHAGFKYVHEISGQGLRPVFDTPESPDAESLLSWRSLATKAGYLVLDHYSVKTRTIYPYPKPDGKNPSISMTYFCVPSSLYARFPISEHQKLGTLVKTKSVK